MVLHVGQYLVYWDSELCVALICLSSSLVLRLTLASFLVAELGILLVCLLSQLINLHGSLLHCDSIVVLKCISFCDCKDLYQCLAGNDSQLAV